MTPAEHRARTHLVRAMGRAASAHEWVTDHRRAQAEIDEAMAALAAASDALMGQVLAMPAKEGR